ncbi:MAG: hypothetical protein O2U61_07655 [Candidatus Bathyarchaeota archaeon]|nr:hypothetical protein [Candidatus Bathyarchaeota archaeon]
MKRKEYRTEGKRDSTMFIIKEYKDRPGCVSRCDMVLNHYGPYKTKRGATRAMNRRGYEPHFCGQSLMYWKGRKDTKFAIIRVRSPKDLPHNETYLAFIKKGGKR